jgi:hypothetical protein
LKPSAGLDNVDLVMTRIRRIGTVLAVLALVILLFRPIMLDAIGAPFGAHNSPDVQLMHASNTPHCELLTDCEIVSIASLGLDFVPSAFLLVLAGFVLMFALERPRIMHSWKALVPNPPPLSALS